MSKKESLEKWRKIGQLVSELIVELHKAINPEDFEEIESDSL